MLYALIALGSGALYALAFPNAWGSGAVPLSPLALVLILALLARARSTRRRVLFTLLHQTGFNLAGFYWVPHTLQEFGGLPSWLSHLLALGLAPVLNPALWGQLIWLAYSPRLPGVERWPVGMRVFCNAVFLSAIELVLPQQFPVYAGHVWLAFAPHLSFAPVGGAGIYSFFTWWFVLGLVPVLGRRPWAKSAVAASLLFAGLHLFVALPARDAGAEGRSVNLRLVQANIGNFLKVQSELGDESATEDVVARYQRLSLTSYPQDLDLIVWPETAYPFAMVSEDMLRGDERIPEIFRELIARTNAELAVGGYDQKPGVMWGSRFETDYNTVFLFGAQGQLRDLYHKHILIPFGETIPVGPLKPTVAKLLPMVAFFAKGERTPAMSLKNGSTFAAPICYEILQSEFVAQLLNLAPRPIDFILNLTNDSWYGDTAEPEQHLFLAKWRALEFQRPIVRATNTGISTVIYPDGSEGARLGVGEQGVLDFRLTLPLRAPVTTYQRYGHLVLVALWALIGSAFSAFWWWRNRP